MRIGPTGGRAGVTTDEIEQRWDCICHSGM